MLIGHREDIGGSLSPKPNLYDHFEIRTLRLAKEQSVHLALYDRTACRGFALQQLDGIFPDSFTYERVSGLEMCQPDRIWGRSGRPSASPCHVALCSGERSPNRAWPSSG